MINLNFKNYFKNFLYDLDNFITIYDNYLHVFNYSKLNKLSKNEIIISFINYKITISGNNLKIKKMSSQELLINGTINKLEFIYE